MVEDVKALKDKLDATEDDDEQRVLEEDITGKVLASNNSLLVRLKMDFIADPLNMRVRDPLGDRTSSGRGMSINSLSVITHLGQVVERILKDKTVGRTVLSTRVAVSVLVCTQIEGIEPLR